MIAASPAFGMQGTIGRKRKRTWAAEEAVKYRVGTF